MSTPGIPDTGEISGAPPRDDALVAGPDIHSPGQPPNWGDNDPTPKTYGYKRKKSSAADAGPPPAKDAKKGEWEAFAVKRGWDEATAKAATKDELVRQLGDSSSSSASSDAAASTSSDSTASA